MRKLFAVLLFLLFFLSLAGTSFAATAAPVAISTIGVAGGTVTVTTSAPHALSASTPSGFCITGSSVTADNVCGVVLTSGTSTTLTFSMTGLAVCSASCGSITPAKKIVWLQTQTVSGGFQVNYLLWIATTNGITGRTSSWTGASNAENTALGSGVFIEVLRTVFFPIGTTLAQAQTQMVLDWTAQQNTQTSSVQPGAFFGDFFDTGWLQ